MWLLVFFDLPVTTASARKRASEFRRFLKKDGYLMLQLSVYARVCNGEERAEKHALRLKANLPPKGSVRLMQITDKQYERMQLLVGKKNRTEGKCGSQQLVLF